MNTDVLRTGPVVVLGAGGFIGARLVSELLTHGCPEIRAVDRTAGGRMSAWSADPRVRAHTVDLVDPRAADRLAEVIAGASCVVHLAASTAMDRGVLDGGAEIVEAARLDLAIADAVRNFSRSAVLVFASSSAVYGRLASERACAEEDGPLRPISAYGAAKVAGESMLSSYHELFGLDVRVLRFGTVLGAGLDRGVVPALVRQVLDGAAELSVLGDGTQQRSFVHVDDAVRAISTTARTPGPRFEVYNVAGEGSTSVAQVAALVAEEAGGKPVRYGTRKQGWAGDIPVVRLDASRLRALGWHGGSSLDAVRRGVADLLRTGVELREDELNRRREVRT
ncbi:NAD-dependent epimerase/dehydratase family protein [Saccharomonospora azurea]|uniref:NAD-dependent epimerase/dehydratase family protein n=1 Tax=Saccharomonospora azurea TaxID=40988 RepID=UPI003D8AF9FB